MKNKLKYYIKEIVSFVVILTILTNIISLYRSNNLNKKELNLAKIILIDNKKYELPKDKPVIIHFWATWCPTCKVEASNIQTISQKYEVLTIAVNSKSDENIKIYLKEHNLKFKVINDEDGFYANKFNISVYPTTLIYDKDKNLVFSEVGYTSTIGLWFRMLWVSF